MKSCRRGPGLLYAPALSHISSSRTLSLAYDDTLYATTSPAVTWGGFGIKGARCSASYMDSIPVAIPPNKDVASSPTPPATMTTPRDRAMRWLLGSVFSAKMMSAAVSIQAKFIIPSATSPTISPAQQPRHSTPWTIPSRTAPVAPERHLRKRKNSGLLQRAWQMRFSGVNW